MCPYFIHHVTVAAVHVGDRVYVAALISNIHLDIVNIKDMLVSTQFEHHS